MAQRYLVALGCNRPHQRHGAPRKVVAAALDRLDRKGIEVKRASPVIETAPHGPSRRRYANAVAVIRTRLDPDELLDRLKRIEAKFGRRMGGQRWGARVLDLDIVLWSGGAYDAPGIVIPHTQFRERMFVLAPALAVAASWRDPITGLSLRHLQYRLSRRLTRPHPLP